MAGNESKIILDFIIKGVKTAKDDLKFINKEVNSLKSGVLTLKTATNDLAKAMSAISAQKEAFKSIQDLSSALISVQQQLNPKTIQKAANSIRGLAGGFKSLNTSARNTNSGFGKIGTTIDTLIPRARNLKDGLSQTTGVLDTVATKAGSTGAALKGLKVDATAAGKAVKGLNTGLSKATPAATKAGSVAKKTSMSFREMGQAIGDVGRGFAIMGAAATAALVVSAKEAIKFEEAMYNINAIAKTSQFELGMMAQGARDLAKSLEVRDTATGVAQAMHTLVLSGIESGKALEIAGVAAKAAAAGMSETKTAVKALSALMNSYNQKTVQDSIKFSDQLFKVVERGVLTFEGLAENLGAVVAIAAPMGVAFDEVGAAYIELTRAGISVAEAETAIASLLRQLGAPSKSAKKNAKELGMEIGSTALKTKGLSNMLFEMMEATGGNEEAIKRIIPDWRGMKAVLALTKNEGLAYTDSLREMQNAQKGVGATQLALNEQMKSTAFQLAQLNAYWTDLKIELGNIVTEAGLPFIQLMKSIIAGFVAMPDWVKKTVVSLAALVSVIGAAGAALSVFMFLLTPLIALFSGSGGAIMAFVTAKIAIGGLVAAITTFAATIAPVVLTVGLFIGYITTMVALIGELSGEFDGAGDALTQFMEYMTSSVWKRFYQILSDIYEKAKAVFGIFKDWADTRADEKALAVRQENARQIIATHKNLIAEGKKLNAEKLKDLKDNLKKETDAILNAQNISDEVKKKHIKRSKELYETQKGIIERSHALTIDQMKKIRDAYQTEVNEKGITSKQRQMRIKNVRIWTKLINEEESLKATLRSEAQMRADEKASSFNTSNIGGAKTTKKDDTAAFNALQKRLLEERMKRELDEVGFKTFIAERTMQERVKQINEMQGIEKAAKDKLIAEVYEVFQAEIVAIQEEGIADHQKYLDKINKQVATASEKAGKEAEDFIQQGLKNYYKSNADKLKSDIDANKQRYSAGEIFAKEYFEAEQRLLLKQKALFERGLISYKDNEEEKIKIQKKLDKANLAIKENNSKKTETFLQMEMGVWEKLLSLVKHFGDTLQKSSIKGITAFGSFVNEAVSLGSTLNNLWSQSEEIITSFNKLKGLSKGGLEFKEIVQNADALGGVFSVAMTIGNELINSFGELVEVFEILNEAFADGKVTASEWNDVALQITRTIPFIGDAMADLTVTLQSLTASVLGWFGLYSEDDIINDYILKIERAQNLEKEFQSEHDRYQNDKEKAVEQFYKEYERAIGNAYDAEKEAMENNIELFEDKIDVYKDAINALQDELDELDSRGQKQQTFGQFQTARATTKAGLDPDFYRDPITHFELTRKEIELTLEAAVISGQMSLKEMNEALMQEAIKSNIYYTEIANDLEDGTREQFEYLEKANDAYKDYADLVKETETMRIQDGEAWGEQGIKQFEDKIKQEESLKEVEEGKLEVLKNEYDNLMTILDDRLKDMWGSFEDTGLDAVNNVISELTNMAILLEGSGQIFDTLKWELVAAGGRSVMPTYDTSFESGINLFDALQQSELGAIGSQGKVDAIANVVKMLGLGFEDYTGKTLEQYKTSSESLRPDDPAFSYFAEGGVADTPSIFGEAGAEAAFTAQQVKGMYDFIVSSTMGGGNSGGLTINVGQVVANNPQQFTNQLKTNMPYIQRQLGKSYRNAYST